VDGNPSDNSFTKQLRDAAADEVALQYSGLAKSDPLEFIKLCHKKFCENKLKAFPYMCDVARTQNYLKWKELQSIGNTGKYTNSVGWSENRTFKFDYEIPEELYQFMQNLVYQDFWTEENRPIWRKFMKKVCDGMDPAYILKWVRSQYGADQGKVTSHGL